MSQHHRAQKWSTHSPKLRKLIQPQLPLRCLNCPHPVMPDESFQVGHRQDAALGGEPTIENCGPTHTFCRWCRKRCNQVSGGKLGAAMTNRSKASTKRADRGLRRWV